MQSSLEFFQSALGFGLLFVEYVLFALALMIMAKKEGVDNAWFAWVPILNFVLMLRLADMELWYILLFLVPCVGFFVFIYMWWQICENRGKPGILSLLMIVPLGHVLVPLYLAFTD